MKEDEYIDLDKLNEKEQGSDLSKEQIITKAKTEKPKKKTAKKTTKKKATKTVKTKKPKKQKTKNSSNNKLIYLLLAIIALAIMIVAAYNYFKPAEETETTKENIVLAIVNEEPLLEEEVQTRANWLRLINGLPITDDQALELSIDMELLSQEAKKRNKTVDEEELNDFFTRMASEANLELEELIEYIEGLGLNYELVRSVVKKEILASKVIDDETENITITEEEMLNYYEENEQYFYNEEGLVTFEEVKDNIENHLKAMIAEEKYDDLLTILKEEAEIVYLLETEEAIEESQEEPTQVIEIDLEDFLDEEELEELQELENQTINQTEELVEETPEEIEEEVEEIIEEEVEEPTTQTESERKLELANCLTNKGAKMYTVYWSPHGEQQLEAFGEYSNYIKTIECDADGTNPKIEECQETITRTNPVWPTWKINNELYEGYHNLHILAQISGCPY